MHASGCLSEGARLNRETHAFTPLQSSLHYGLKNPGHFSKGLGTQQDEDLPINTLSTIRKQAGKSNIPAHPCHHPAQAAKHPLDILRATANKEDRRNARSNIYVCNMIPVWFLS